MFVVLDIKDQKMKIKAWIYQKTGLYFAHKEELAYIHSEDYWAKFADIGAELSDELTLRDIHGVVVGLWQAKHGFYRTLNLRDL